MNTKQRFMIIMWFVGLLLTGFSPHFQRPNDNTTNTFVTGCYVIFFPLWILSIWYWQRYYKIRGQSALLGGAIAFLFGGLSVFVMIIDAPLRALFSKVQFGPCPNCGKTKLIRENPSQLDHVAQPQCPHCKVFVGSVATATSIPQKIEELHQLRDKNFITQDEFEQKKTELFSRM